jgi:hypothetical protein
MFHTWPTWAVQTHGTMTKSSTFLASSTALAADALRKTAAATVYRVSKNIVSSETHTRIHDGGEYQHNENTQTLPSRP